MQSIPYVLEVGDQEVVLTPDPAHEFTATTEQVALGYGVSADNIRKHKETKAEELIEGKHFLTVSNTHAQPGRGAQSQTLWTKRGIVRLGFFIRSARARLFRDMTEDLVIGQMQAAPQPAPALITAEKFGKVTGQSRNAVINYCKRYLKIPPVAVGYKKHSQATYLFELSALLEGYKAAGWTFEDGCEFETYTGRTTTDMAAVQTMKRISGAGGRVHQPRLLPTTDSLSLARELVQVETRRAEILAALGGAA